MKITRTGPIIYQKMLIDKRATKPGERFYIKKGSAGHKSIGAKNVKILAQNIVYYSNRN